MSRTHLVCHRGANQIAPENTYSAAEGAIAYGASFVEIDVRMSADGVLYILHDETVDRTTNGTGAIEAMTSTDLDALDAGSWFGPEFAGQRLPRLDEYLGWLKGKCGTYIEIKKAPTEAVRDLVRKHDFADNSYYFSFDEDIVKELIWVAPDLPVMALNRLNGDMQAVVDHGYRIIEFLPDEMSPENLQRARDLGLSIQVFHPEDDADVFRAMLDSGIDYANIDHPETFNQVRSTMALV